MDQTPVPYDNSSGTKQRCTFMLTISSDGLKFPPYMIFKSERKTPLLNPFPESVIIRKNKKDNWINERMMLDWAE